MNDFSPEIRTDRRRRRGGGSRAVPIFFFAGGCLLIILSIGVFVGAVVMRSSDSVDAFTWLSPADLVNTDTLVPETVFLPLTGLEPNDALSRTMDRGQLENAFALVAYDYSLSYQTRIGTLLQLAPRYNAIKDTRKATLCYQIAAQLATLAPTFSDASRLDAYLQAAAGLRDLNARDAARWVTDQTYLVAQFSPTLQRDLRARRLAQVADAYAALSLDSLANQARDKSRDAATSPGETATAILRTSFNPAAGQMPASPGLNNAMQTRVAAAKQLQGDINDNPSKNASGLPKDSVAQLGDALRDEDSARMDFYDQQLPIAKDSAVRLALLRDKLNWLALKWRVARVGFGAHLVGEWEKDSKNIVTAMGDTFAEYAQIVEALAAQDKDALQATDDTLRREVFHARWGWFIGASEKELRGLINDNNQNLRDAGTIGLRLDSVTRNNRTLYLLVPDELLELGERALPK